MKPMKQQLLLKPEKFLVKNAIENQCVTLIDLAINEKFKKRAENNPAFNFTKQPSNTKGVVYVRYSAELAAKIGEVVEGAIDHNQGGYYPLFITD